VLELVHTGLAEPIPVYNFKIDGKVIWKQDWLCSKHTVYWRNFTPFL